MGHFAELNSENKVLRVVKACNIDIVNNGGDESESAAKAFENVCKLSNNGVKWVQTSYNSSFRKNYAGIDYSYDQQKDAFIAPKPFNSWILNQNTCKWEAPIPFPSDTNSYTIQWEENNQRWIGSALDNNFAYKWNSVSNSWENI